MLKLPSDVNRPPAFCYCRGSDLATTVVLGFFMPAILPIKEKWCRPSRSPGLFQVHIWLIAFLFTGCCFMLIRSSFPAAQE